jgi:hypothetical protein
VTFAARPLSSTVAGPLVALSSQTITEALLTFPASAGLQLLNTGIAQSVTNIAAPVFLQNWITPLSGMSGYDARVTIASGPTGLGIATGTFGAWLNLGTSRTWALDNAGGNGNSSMTVTAEIRNTATLTILATATIVFNANSN